MVRTKRPDKKSLFEGKASRTNTLKPSTFVDTATDTSFSPYQHLITSVIRRITCWRDIILRILLKSTDAIWEAIYLRASSATLDLSLRVRRRDWGPVRSLAYSPSTRTEGKSPSQRRVSFMDLEHSYCQSFVDVLVLPALISKVIPERSMAALSETKSAMCLDSFLWWFNVGVSRHTNESIPEMSALIG